MVDDDPTFKQWLSRRSFLEDAVVKATFDHVRNITIAAAVLGAAGYMHRRAGDDPLWLASVGTFSLAVIGFGLLFINYLHGLRKFSELGVSARLLGVFSLPLYVPTTALLMPLLWKST